MVTAAALPASTKTIRDPEEVDEIREDESLGLAAGAARLSFRSLTRLALAEYRRFQPGAESVRQGKELRIAIDLDRLLGSVANDVAVMAPVQMIFQFRACGGV